MIFNVLRAILVSIGVVGGAMLLWAVIVLPVVFLVTMDEQPGENREGAP